MSISHEQLVLILVRDRARFLSYIWAIVRDEELAEDVYQELCVEAVRKSSDIKDETHLTNWLRRGCRHRSIDALRRQQTTPLIFDDRILDGLEDDMAADTAPTPDVQHALRHCLSELAPNARQLIDLRYTENLTGQALASRLGRPVNTIYVTLSRAHRVLADCIRRRLAESEASHG